MQFISFTLYNEQITYVTSCKSNHQFTKHFVSKTNTKINKAALFSVTIATPKYYINKLCFTIRIKNYIYTPVFVSLYCCCCFLTILYLFSNQHFNGVMKYYYRSPRRVPSFDKKKKKNLNIYYSCQIICLFGKLN